MTKEEFLELASKTFDQINPVVNEETKIPLDKDIFDEIADQISSEFNDQGNGLIEDYELEIYSREIEMTNVTFNFREIESVVKEVLERYFEKK